LSLVQDAETAPSDPWDPVTVVLRVRPIFRDLFRPSDRQAIATQMDQLASLGGDTRHEVTVAPMLADRAKLQAGHSPLRPLSRQ
jgi:hypothetical protein